MAEDGAVDQTAPTGQNLDDIVAKLTGEFDKRFQGFQGILDRRDREYREMLEDIKSADLEPEQREQVQASRLQQERDELKRQVDILSKRKEFPEEVDLLTELLKGQSLEDQLKLLASFRKAEEKANAQGDEPKTKPTPVDKNNAPRKQALSLEDAADHMTKELSDQILEQQGNEPGLLRRLRGVVQGE